MVDKHLSLEFPIDAIQPEEVPSTPIRSIAVSHFLSDCKRHLPFH